MICLLKDLPGICKNLRTVYDEIWKIGVNQTLVDLFDNTETLVRSKELHKQLLEAMVFKNF